MKRRAAWMAAGLALAAGLAAPGSAAAQGRSPAWESSFRFQLETFGEDADWSSWVSATSAIQRVDDSGTFGLEFIESRRFDRWDAALAVEAWRGLWTSAYGNLRGEVAPDADGRAEVDVRAELYQGWGEGWEAGAGWRHQRFDDSGIEVDAVSLSAARYFDGGYVRAGAELSGLDGMEGAAMTAVARYYFAPPEDLVEVGVSWGKSLEVVGSSPVVAFDHGGHAHARFEIFPWSRIGFGLSAHLRTFEDIPVRHGFSATLRARW